MTRMQSSYLLLNGLRVHYLFANLEDGGRPVVLLHGLGANARIWELVAARLVEAGLAPLAPDLRGHGLTDKPDGDYGFATFLADLAAFSEANNLEKPLLIGHSWGAMLALEYAARFQFGPKAPAGIVLVEGGMIQLDDAPDGSPSPTWEQVQESLTPPRLDGMPLTEFLAGLKRIHPAWQPDEQIIPLILSSLEIVEVDRPAMDGGSEVISPRLPFEHQVQIIRAIWEYKTYERYPRLRCPVLMIPARDPEPLSPQARELLAAKEKGLLRAGEHIPHLQVQWMADTLHDAPLQRPAELAALIQEFARSLA